MDFYYVKQVENRFGNKRGMFLTKNNSLAYVFDDETVKKIRSQMEANTISIRSERYFGGKFEVWAVCGKKHYRTAFSPSGGRLTASEIESRVRSGRAVSASDLNRFAKTPRGMMFLASIKKGA